MVKIQRRVHVGKSTKMSFKNLRYGPRKTVSNHLKTHGTIVRSKARWYEFGEKNYKYFYNLEKRNHRQKHIRLVTKENGTSISDPKEILDEEANFFKRIYESKNTNPELDQFKFFFQCENITPLEQEESDSCEGLLSLEECANVLKSFSNDKTPGSDGLSYS